MNARRVYRVLLWLYPKSFRQRYGAAMTETFADWYRHTPRIGLRFWWFVVTDAVHAALVQHVDGWTSTDRRMAVRWLFACTMGTVLCNAVGSALMWGFSYFYHPYLEGATFVPSIYGVLLGAALGGVQAVMFTRVSERMTWILLTAAAAAAGLELASWMAPLTGPVGYGVVAGSTVASAQWLALRGRMNRPSAAALTSAFAVSVAAVAGSVAVTHALAGFNALQVPAVAAGARIDALLVVLYAPMNWTESLSAIASMAIAGLILGVVTVKPASSWLARAH